MKQSEVQTVESVSGSETTENPLRFFGSKAAFFLLMCLMMATGVSAQEGGDVSSLSDSIVGEITAVKVILFAIGAAVVGIKVVPAIVNWVKSMIH